MPSDSFFTSHSIGVDGCPGGWVGVSRRAVCVAVSLETLIETFDARVVALDMPMGLPDNKPRGCEQIARGLLGRPRAASVFPVPMRAALNGCDHAHASDLNQAACGKRLSAQTFNILAKIRAVDALLDGESRYLERLWETHPEVSFAAMNKRCSILQPLHDSKKSAVGAALRQGLIAAQFGTHAFADARRMIARKQAADDDIADAFACLFTAERIAAGAHVSLPDPAPLDSHGLPMRICY
jgi:predicted RNase H-like nuclease